MYINAQCLFENNMFLLEPDAYALIKGNKDNLNLQGIVKFYQTINGVIVWAEILGLPNDKNFYAFHIHDGNMCSGTMEDAFKKAGSHLNLNNSEHPFHEGDLPPLINANGMAISIFLSNRFSIKEIVNKTIIIHAKPDDFKTQPSGDSGTRIACGEIVGL